MSNVLLTLRAESGEGQARLSPDFQNETLIRPWPYFGPCLASPSRAVSAIGLVRVLLPACSLNARIHFYNNSLVRLLLVVCII